MMEDDQTRRCRSHWLAFLDVLGFGKFVEDRAKDERTDEAIAVVRQAFEKTRGILEASALTLQLGDDLSVEMFSDTVCVAIDDEASEAGLWLLVLVASIQLQMALDVGLPSRGAIVRGGHYSDETIIFSPALVRAHDLERKSAVYPRVILAPDDAHALLPLPPEGEFLDYSEEMLWRDFDGSLFVNYLNVLRVQKRSIQEWRLEDHRKMIELNLKKHAADLRVAPKYWWLTSYHNAFCRSVDDSEAQVPGAALPPPGPDPILSANKETSE